MTALANVALAELHQRTASTRAAVHAGRMRPVDGERFLRCWLSIALAAGARPGECSALLGNWVEETELDERHARIVLLDNGPPKAEWITELARARDHAGGKARAYPTDMTLSVRHHALDSLCIYLGGRPEEVVSGSSVRSSDLKQSGPSEMQTAQRELEAVA